MNDSKSRLVMKSILSATEGLLGMKIKKILELTRVRNPDASSGKVQGLLRRLVEAGCQPASTILQTISPFAEYRLCDRFGLEFPSVV